MRTGKRRPGNVAPQHRKRATRRAAGLIGMSAVVVVVLAGCGVRPSAVIPGGPAPSGPVVSGPPGGAVLYFVLAGRPTASQRGMAPADPAGVLTLLAAGPDDAERAAGLTTEVPGNAAPLSVAVASSGVTVALGLDVSALSTMATQQIACTIRHLDSALPPVTLTGGGRHRKLPGCPEAP
jgi:hypothetical protein